MLWSGEFCSHEGDLLLGVLLQFVDLCLQVSGGVVLGAVLLLLYFNNVVELLVL